MKIKAFFLFHVSALIVLVGCGAPQVPESTADPVPSLSAMIHDDDRLTTFAALLGHEELAKNLEDRGPYTVFAPTNEAFAALSEGMIEALLQHDNRRDLNELVGSLVAPGVWRWEPLQTLAASTMCGNRALITGDGEHGAFAGAPIIAAPSVASNGVLYRLSVAPLPRGWTLRDGRIRPPTAPSYP